MSWWADRRGYGELRLPYRRRSERRENWLGLDLRQRRREVLRKNWWDLVKIVVAFTACLVSFLFIVHEHPRLQAGLAGLFLGVMTVCALVFLSLMDCSLLSRFGRWVEEMVGDELRTTSGIYGVISNLPLPFSDVDHVVITPEGIYATEVKTYLVRQLSLDRTYDLPRKRGQAARGAAAVRELLLEAGIDVPVRAVVILAGPGAPPMVGPDERGRVRVAAFRRTGEWRTTLRPRATIDRTLAVRVADVLGAHRTASTTPSAQVARLPRARKTVPTQASRQG